MRALPLFPPRSVAAQTGRSFLFEGFRAPIWVRAVTHFMGRMNMQ